MNKGIPHLNPNFGNTDTFNYSGVLKVLIGSTHAHFRYNTIIR